MEGSFITIHGIDGTGKTTTAECLVGHLRAVGRKAIGSEDIDIGLENPERLPWIRGCGNY